MSNPAYGKSLDTALIRHGLKLLCAGIHFDMGAALGLWHPRMKDFQGVFYDGKHVCSMDRGIAPEFKLWSIENGPIEIHPEKVQTTEGAWGSYTVIDPSDPTYPDGLVKSATFSDGYELHEGKLKKHRGFVIGQKCGPVVKLGWRHTFERLLYSNLPNITRRNLGIMFEVDMLKYPVGPPEEVMAALLEE